MAPAISIYSRGRFSINYYCCSCNPGELKTNKRMTTETDSLGSFKNSFIFFPKVGADIFQAHEGLGEWAAVHPSHPLLVLVLPTLKGAQIIKYEGDKWVINGWEAKAGVEAESAPGRGRGGVGRCCTPTGPPGR